jgi:DNA polymerase III sliding clamp (beta) subunit (PCNA family)
MMSKTSKTTITVAAVKFAAEATWIAKAFPKSGMPIFAAVQVAVDDGALTLRRSNLDAFATTTLPGTGGTAAVMLVDAGQLAAALKGGGGDVKVDFAEDRLRLAVNGRILSLPLLDTGDNDFPAWPQFTPVGDGVILRSSQLARALTSVSDDDNLPQLGVVKFENGMMVSTDRFRLTRIRYDDAGFTTQIRAQVLRPFAGGGDGELLRVEHGVGVGDKPPQMVRLSDWGYGRVITAPVPDTDFPKYAALIPDPDTTPIAILLRRRDLLEAVDGENADLIIAEDGQITVRSTELRGGIEVEQNVGVLRVIRGDGLPLRVRLNSRRLVDCLKGIAAGAVVLLASTPDKPVLVMFSEDLHLLMPIRVPA